MRKSTFWLISLVALLGVSSAIAELAVPRLTGRVVDNANMLTNNEELRITAALEALERAPQGAQMAVLTVPTLKGDALELFSIRVVEAWKLGKKEGTNADNGLLLLISSDDRDMRLEVGYGLEGRLTDARCGDITRGMSPYFKAQRFADGILYAIGTAQQQLTGSLPSGMPAVPRHSTRRKSSNGSFMLLLFLFFILPAIMRGRLGWGHTIFLAGSGGFRGGGGFGGGFGGGGFSGGGGSFGGGGASGSW
jgi:uncharacterized protein